MRTSTPTAACVEKSMHAWSGVSRPMKNAAELVNEVSVIEGPISASTAAVAPMHAAFAAFAWAFFVAPASSAAAVSRARRSAAADERFRGRSKLHIMTKRSSTPRPRRRKGSTFVVIGLNLTPHQAVSAIEPATLAATSAMQKSAAMDCDCVNISRQFVVQRAKTRPA